MKIKAKSVWKHNRTGAIIRVSRLRKNLVLFHPFTGGGAEQVVTATEFLAQYKPME